MSRLELMRNLKFDTEDLRTNRDGKISPTQRERFQPPKLNPVIMLTMLAHLGLVGGIIAVLAILTGSKALWFVLILVTILTLMPFGWMQEAHRVRPVVMSDVNRGKVVKSCGIVILRENKGRTTTFDLLVDGVALAITPSEAAAFRNENRYCVYYLPESKTLLSAEPMQ